VTRSRMASKRCASTWEDGEMEDVKVTTLDALAVAVAVADAVIVGVGTSSVEFDVEFDVALYVELYSVVELNAVETLYAVDVL
jgi:hypothetical protein